MELDVIRMVLPVLVMIGIGYFCNRTQIFDMNGLKGLKALLGDIMLPVMLFNAFFTAAYSVRVVVVFLVVFIGYGIAIALGYVLRPAVKPYGKYLPFLLASAEGGMLGYALYGLIVGSQSGFAAVDLGQTVFAYTVWLGCLTSVDGEKVDAKALLKNMLPWYGTWYCARCHRYRKSGDEFCSRRYRQSADQHHYSTDQRCCSSDGRLRAELEKRTAGTGA